MAKDADIDFRSHHTDAMIENAYFLFRWGVSFSEAAARLNTSEDALDKALQRRKKKDLESGSSDSDSYYSAGTCEGPVGWPVYALRRAG